MMKSLLRTRKIFTFLLLAAIFFSNTLLAQMPKGDLANGEKLFNGKCASCHLIEGTLVGPGLKGALKRWDGDFDKLADFVKNGAGKYQNDPYIAGLIAKHGTLMAAQGLNPQQVADVLAYVEGGGDDDKDGKDVAITYTPVPKDNSLLRYLFIGIVILLIVIVYLSTRIYNSFREEKDFQDPHGKGFSWSKINAFIFPLFFILFFAGIAYETVIHTTPHFMRPEAASTTGVAIDKLFNNTMYVTLIVFIVTQILLAWYVFRYRFKRKRRAYFFSHNNTIEFIWTIIPAIVLTFLVLDGFKVWRNATDKPAEGSAMEIEAFARQFDWTFRYPGPDGKLGKTDFKKISGSNPLGLDESDPASADDILTDTLYLPVKHDIYLRLRSHDVLHAAYLVHFRAQLYAQPGMDNRMRFEPIYTTEHMRNVITKNPKFNFELACNQLCGASHYNMRRVVYIDTKEGYDKWIAAKKPFLQKEDMQQALNTAE